MAIRFYRIDRRVVTESALALALWLCRPLRLGGYRLTRCRSSLRHGYLEYFPGSLGCDRLAWRRHGLRDGHGHNGLYGA